MEGRGGRKGVRTRGGEGVRVGGQREGRGEGCEDKGRGGDG